MPGCQAAISLPRQFGSFRIDQSAPGSEIWTYAPQPADRLVVVFAGEPVIEIEGHVVAFQEEKPTHLPFDIVFLRLPWAYALAPGSWVELYRPGSVADGYTLPDTRIGSAVIVRADDEIAAALLVNVRRSDLDEGDRFRGIETALQ